MIILHTSEVHRLTALSFCLKMSVRRILRADFHLALESIIEDLPGITSLFDSQKEVLKDLLNGDNVFLTLPTNSGKSLPPLILPRMCRELIKLGYSFPHKTRVLFVTALNSLQYSMIANAKDLGIRCTAITNVNIVDVMQSDVDVLFIGPEILKLTSVTKTLLRHRAEFICKVVDEAHLGTLNVKCEGIQELSASTLITGSVNMIS